MSRIIVTAYRKTASESNNSSTVSLASCFGEGTLYTLKAVDETTNTEITIDNKIAFDKVNNCITMNKTLHYYKIISISRTTGVWCSAGGTKQSVSITITPSIKVNGDEVLKGDSIKVKSYGTGPSSTNYGTTTFDLLSQGQTNNQYYVTNWDTLSLYWDLTSGNSNTPKTRDSFTDTITIVLDDTPWTNYGPSVTSVEAKRSDKDITVTVECKIGGETSIKQGAEAQTGFYKTDPSCILKLYQWNRTDKRDKTLVETYGLLIGSGSFTDDILNSGTTLTYNFTIKDAPLTKNYGFSAQLSIGDEVSAEQETGEMIKKIGVPLHISNTNRGIGLGGYSSITDSGSETAIDLCWDTNFQERIVLKNNNENFTYGDTLPTTYKQGQLYFKTGADTSSSGSSSGSTVVGGFDEISAGEKEGTLSSVFAANSTTLNLYEGNNINLTVDGTENSITINSTAVPTSRTINDKALTGDIVLTASDISAAEATHTHDLSDNTMIGVLPITKGGTGAETAVEALVNLGAAKASHTHEDYVNKSAFSKIKVGDTTAVSAEKVEDEFTLQAGNNIDLSVNNKTITISSNATGGGTDYTLPTASVNTLGGVKTNSNAIDGYSICPINNGYVYYKDTDTTYTLSDLNGVPANRTINNHALTNDITLSAEDVGAATSDHTHDLSGDTITGILSIAKGGTGASTAEEALTNLGAAKASHEHTDYKNQNAFSGISIIATADSEDRSTISASSPTSTFGLKGGTNITLGVSNNVITINSTASSSSGDTYSLPKATNTTLGGVKVGETLADTSGYTACYVDSEGKIYYKTTTSSSSDTSSTSLEDLMGSNAIGSSTQPIYWTGTKWANTGYTLGASVPSNAKFTDTTYTLSGLGGVPTSRTINGKALTTDITLSVDDVGAASSDHTHTLTDLSGTLSISKGGTGATDTASAREALGITLANLGAAALGHQHTLTSGALTGTLPISKGGTGATTIAAARNALGLGNTEGAVPIANGGTGATTATAALSNLGGAAKDHTHSTYVNQNAFSNIKIGSTTISASSETDTITLNSSGNVSISSNGNTITISSSGGSSYNISYGSTLPATSTASIGDIFFLVQNT